ncbi:MAG: hydrogenase maturation protease [Ilumatobacter sp.]|jgi:hydrogenase maturation protease
MSDTAGAPRRIVVIGVGHRDRADDGIGPAVVDALSHRTDRVTTVVREGDLAVLPLLWERDDDVVIVDASLESSERVGQIHEIDPDQLASSIGLSTHGLNVADAIRLAERIGRSPARLRVIGIGAHDFGHGSMSRELHERVNELVDELVVLLGLD